MNLIRKGVLAATTGALLLPAFSIGTAHADTIHGVGTSVIKNCQKLDAGTLEQSTLKSCDWHADSSDYVNGTRKRISQVMTNCDATSGDFKNTVWYETSEKTGYSSTNEVSVTVSFGSAAKWFSAGIEGSTTSSETWSSEYTATIRDQKEATIKPGFQGAWFFTPKFKQYNGLITGHFAADDVTNKLNVRVPATLSNGQLDGTLHWSTWAC